MNTTIVNRITINEVQEFNNELDRIDYLWQVHNTDITALRDGRSIHLKWCDFDLNFQFGNWDRCPITTKFIKRCAGGKSIARSYWHMLRPGDRIYRHSDIALTYAMNGKLFKRYQVYLNIPIGAELMLDDYTVFPQHFEYSLVDFSLTKPHSYFNNSNLNWKFLVFDVLNIGYNVMNDPYQ